MDVSRKLSQKVSAYPKGGLVYSTPLNNQSFPNKTRNFLSIFTYFSFIPRFIFSDKSENILHYTATKLLISGSVMISLLSPLPAMTQTLKKESYGALPSGETVELYTLHNKNGMEVQFISYGGIITAIKVPDKNGKTDNVVLGFSDLEGYSKKDAEANICFGALIGRYANRIARGTFVLEGKTYHTPINLPPNTLHGGNTGFNKKLWHVQPLSGLKQATGAELTLTSADGEEGFPGKLQVKVRYILDDDNQLHIHYHATTDKPTVINLTNHSYFNLAGEGSGSVANHRLKINASLFTPTDANGIPTGQISPVAQTPFDFRAMHAIGDFLRSNDQQMLQARGYDHNWIIDGYDGKTLREAAILSDPQSGRSLTVLTTQPAMQVYTGNSLNGAYAGPSGRAYRQTDGVALETQHYPDSPNHPSFPTTTLLPGQEYEQTTVFRFQTAAP